MKSIFIDTAPLQAFNNIKDQYFKKTVAILRNLLEEYVTLITTDYIIDEAYTGLLTKGGYKNAMHFDRWLQKEPCKIVFVDKSIFIQAQQVFRRFNKDKLWSFTDCTSYVVMKELKIKTALTFDEHFEQMGFELLS